MAGPAFPGRRGGTGRTRRSLRLLAGFMVAGALLAALAAVVVNWRQSGYDRNIHKLDGALPDGAGRPAADPGDTWLLIGSDLRGVPAESKWRPGGRSRADTIMLLHIPDGAGRAYVVSFPRDLWVAIPGRGHAKICDAFAYGGSRLLARTVEGIGGVRIDHVAALDFAGFEAMTDALGGVEIHLSRAVHDPTNGWSWPAGRNVLDGAEALRFVRERKGLSGSDLGRIERQHALLMAMAEQATGAGTLANPFKLDAFLQAASRSLALDGAADFGTLRSTALQLIRIGPERVRFLTLPTGPTDWIDDRNVLLPDRAGTGALFAALRAGNLPAHLRQHDLEIDSDLVN